MPDEKAKIEVERRMREQSANIFDLAKPGLLKITLFKVDNGSHILFLTLHHIIVDEWSIGVLKEHLAMHYRKLLDGIDLEPYSPVIRYADYAHWERRKSVDKGQLEYWKNTLSEDPPILNLQTDRVRPIRPAFRGKQYTTVLSSSLSFEVLEMARKTEATPFIFLLTVYVILLHRYSGQNDILVGTPVSNRSVKSLEEVLGFFNRYRSA